MYNEPSSDTPGAYLYDEYAVCREVESIKSECDFLIVVYHGGAEKFRYPSPQIRRRFHRMADCGLMWYYLNTHIVLAVRSTIMGLIFFMAKGISFFVLSIMNLRILD